MGGLGFRDIRLFNIALLGRQVWRLLTVKDTLCYNVLSSKYFPDGDLFHSKKVGKPSFTWNSIAIAARDLKVGLGWQIENGGKIDIYKDNWAFEGLNGELICDISHIVHERKVHEM
ncbi:uncharacterized mitochondrial protein AtMg00310-like [Gossypium raimondii]|uniref:uncharacterized mitochondrial protein AtMg00310-like n=1 Tax=Gossypium raimondii TaxID=29730 RepID=UPI00227B04F8|nr:uncharacterized mitochondrial protein AtMg00310-like [Gossypium raimondii]